MTEESGLAIMLAAFDDDVLVDILTDVVTERAHQEKKFPDQDPEIGRIGTRYDRMIVRSIKTRVDSFLTQQKIGAGHGPTLRDILEEEVAELMACAPGDLEAQYDELIDVMASCALWARKIRRLHVEKLTEVDK